MFRWYPSEPSLDLPELALVPELVRKLALEQVWKLASEQGLTPVAGGGWRFLLRSVCLRCPGIQLGSWSSSELCQISGRPESCQRL